MSPSTFAALRTHALSKSMRERDPFPELPWIVVCGVIGAIVILLTGAP